jgi:glycine hydroxymethyltransferase
MSGAQAEQILEHVGIIVNKNTIPYDERKPFDPSGIRLGTPAMTTLGMKETEMEQIGLCISKVLKNKDNKQIAEDVKKEVNALCKQFKFY